MIPGPGRGWALVRSDQEAIRWEPEEYWRETVFPSISGCQVSSYEHNVSVGKSNMKERRAILRRKWKRVRRY